MGKSNHGEERVKVRCHNFNTPRMRLSIQIFKCRHDVVSFCRLSDPQPSKIDMFLGRVGGELCSLATPFKIHPRWDFQSCHGYIVLPWFPPPLPPPCEQNRFFSALAGSDCQVHKHQTFTSDGHVFFQVNGLSPTWKTHKELEQQHPPTKSRTQSSWLISVDQRWSTIRSSLWIEGGGLNGQMGWHLLCPGIRLSFLHHHDVVQLVPEQADQI